MKKIRAVLASSKGFVDLQSVMVGVIISALIAGTAMVSVLGFTRMVNNDNAKTTLSTLSAGLETFYTDKDRYPRTLSELTGDGKYLPASYGKIANTELCYAPQAGDYPQKYVATSKATSTNSLFYITQRDKKAQPATVYPAAKPAPLPPTYKVGDPELPDIAAVMADCK